MNQEPIESEAGSGESEDDATMSVPLPDAQQADEAERTLGDVKQNLEQRIHLHALSHDGFELRVADITAQLNTVMQELYAARQLLIEVQAENERLRTATPYTEGEVHAAWKLLYGARGVYCEEVIDVECKSQDIGDAVLRRHVEICEKHPLNMCRRDLAQRDARIKELEERLEIGFAYGPDGNRVAVQKTGIPDGIFCRDETIRLQDEAIAELRQQLTRAREALETPTLQR